MKIFSWAFIILISVNFKKYFTLHWSVRSIASKLQALECLSHQHHLSFSIKIRIKLNLSLEFSDSILQKCGSLVTLVSLTYHLCFVFISASRLSLITTDNWVCLYLAEASWILGVWCILCAEHCKHKAHSFSPFLRTL